MEGKHYESLAIAGIVAVVFFALLRQCWLPSQEETVPPPTAIEFSHPPEKPRTILSATDPDELLYRYILDVINHGSRRLHYPGGEMEGGYISPEDAPKVACYVMELGGHRCPRAYPKEAQMFFTSVCGGCHGNDGKGLHGSYPDLTKRKLEGFELWKSELQNKRTE